MPWSDLHFLRPLWLVALLALPLFWRILRAMADAGSPWRKACDAALLPHVLARDVADSRATVGRLTLPVVVVSYVLAVVALAGPVWQRLPQPVYQDRSALVILLDLSRSMDAQDVRPSRLARARFKTADILARRQAGLTALVVYAADAYTVVPLTDDVATIQSHLPVLESALMPEQGTHPERAVSKALDLFKNSGVRNGDLLLVTDGVTTEQAERITQGLRRDGTYRLSILGVGTAAGAPIPRDSSGGFISDNAGKPVLSRLETGNMQSLVERTHGILQLAGNHDTEVDALTRFFATGTVDRAAARADVATERWREEGPWLLLPLLPLVALMFRRGLIAVVLLACMPWPRDASALGWNELWQRADQQGAAALARGDAQTAAQRFTDPRWGAVARYRSGDYASALDLLDPPVTADDHYNRGNSLARLGRYGEAIAAYEQVLRIAPDDEDARYNRDLLRQMQQQSATQGQGDGTDGDHSQQEQQPSPGSGEGKREESGERQQESLPGGARTYPWQADRKPGQQDAQSDSTRRAEELLAERRRQQTQDSTGATRQEDRSERAPGEVQPQAGREMEQADEQWLRRIPDDPGGLLRRKFLLQYSQSASREPDGVPW